MDYNINVNGETIKLLRKSNTREHLHDLGGKKDFFFTRTQKVLTLKKKIDEMILKIKNFLKRYHKNNEKAANNRMRENSVSFLLLSLSLALSHLCSLNQIL